MAFHWWQQNSSALQCFICSQCFWNFKVLIESPLNSTWGHCKTTDSNSTCLRRGPEILDSVCDVQVMLMLQVTLNHAFLQLPPSTSKPSSPPVISQYSPFTHLCHLHWPPCCFPKDKVCYTLGLYKYWDQFLLYPLLFFQVPALILPPQGFFSKQLTH